MAKRFSNKPIIGYNGKDPIKIPISQAGELSTEFRHVLLAILNNSEFKTMDDSIQGNRLANAIDKAEGKDFVEIEDGVHDWLKRKAEQVCPIIFRVNGSIVYEAIKEGFEKSNQPSKSSKEKAGKGKADETPAGKE